jgi:competence protein ComEC
MIRRHATPLVVVFCVLLAFCSLKSFFGGHVIFGYAAAIAAASTAIILFTCDSLPMKRAGALFFAACLGSVMGICLLARIEPAGRWTGLPLSPRDVSGFTGRLTQDSSLSEDSKTILRLGLTRAAAEKKGLIVGARGSVLVILDGDYRFFLGQTLVFKTGLASLTTGEGQSYIAFARRTDVSTVGFSGSLWEIRAVIREEIHHSLGMVGYPASALLEALLVGSREDVPSDLSRSFRETGSLHILALSGLHAAIIYGFVLLFLRFAGNRVLKYILGTVMLLFYQFIAGPLPSLLRATLMLMAGGAALLIDRDGEPINLLALSGILILLVDPYQAWSVSFQLSYLALLGLLAVAPLFSRVLAGVVPGGLLATLSISAGAQIATFPIVVSVFGVYYPSGLVAGLILVPLTTAFLWLGLFWLVLSPLLGGIILHAASGVFGGLYFVIQHTASFFARAPGLTVSGAAAPWVTGAAAAMLAILCLLPLKHIRPAARVLPGDVR